VQPAQVLRVFESVVHTTGAWWELPCSDCTQAPASKPPHQRVSHFAARVFIACKFKLDKWVRRKTSDIGFCSGVAGLRQFPSISHLHEFLISVSCGRLRVLNRNDIQSVSVDSVTGKFCIGFTIRMQIYLPGPFFRSSLHVSREVQKDSLLLVISLCISSRCADRLQALTLDICRRIPS